MPKQLLFGRTEEAKRADAGTEALEELLTFDDLFLDYFNHYLALPAFPLRLRYDRLTGSLEEAGEEEDGEEEQEGAADEGGPAPTPPYGATEAQRGRILAWLQSQRLPLFLRSRLWLEFRLGTLLLRRVDERREGGRGGVRGFSRQSEAASSLGSRPPSLGPGPRASSSSPSRPSSPPASSPSGRGGRGTGRGPRLPSRARSLPDNFGRGGSSHLGWGDDGVTAAHLTEWRDQLLAPREETPAPDSTRGYVGEGGGLWPPTRGAPPEGPCLTVLLFEGGGEDEGEGWRQGEGAAPVHDVTLQEVKERTLGTKRGMDQFQRFLEATPGRHLLQFWLQSEELNQCLDVEPEADGDNGGSGGLGEGPWGARRARQLHAQLYRDLQDSHKFHVAPDAQAQLAACGGRGAWPGLPLLAGAQYAALRRLRVYWVPRFLVHRERRRLLGLRPDTRPCGPGDLWPQVPHIPLPDPDPAPRIPHGSSPGAMDGRVGSARFVSASPSAPAPPHLAEPFLLVLRMDPEAGGPFLYYLAEWEDRSMLHRLLLWLEVARLAEGAAPGPWERPRVSALAAWDIYNTYLAPNAPCSTGCEPWDQALVSALRGALQAGRGDETVDLGMFEGALNEATRSLSQAWVEFYRLDIHTFLQFCADLGDSYEVLSDSEPGRSNRSSARRSAEGTSGPSRVRGRRGRTRPRPRPPREAGAAEESGVHFDLKALVEADAVPHLRAVLHNKMMRAAFGRFLKETEPATLRHCLGMLSALWDHLAARGARARRCALTALTETYLSPASRAVVPLSDELLGALQAECDRSGAAGLTDATASRAADALGGILWPSLSSFWAGMSSELKRRGGGGGGGGGGVGLEDPEAWDGLIRGAASMLLARRWRARAGPLGGRAARADPSAADKAAFRTALAQAAEGGLTPELLGFLQRLQELGAEAGRPRAERDLLFYLEVQKFKNAHHADPDHVLLRKKIRIILDCFIKSRLEPTLQVDISPEQAEAVRAAAQACLARPEQLAPRVFDEAQNAVFHELLPFWAGFAREGRIPHSASGLPEPRLQTVLRQRLAMFRDAAAPPTEFHLPRASRSAPRNSHVPCTYSFSMSKGLTLKRPRGSEKRTPPVS
ncbi:regulator of G-protein signaling 22 [Lethenteron reissneri]|uniref:regulator of G-protein signaling 22 n=1 Tax=Lethenteron reissneri TaxID=7753 RepID=UPI002AB74CA0|nr:regulator of G-protein signaling 22 [Lethenteron reissneri]